MTTRFESEEQIDVRDDEATKEPSMYKVYLLNDDYTTMDFVVHVLMTVFWKRFEEATRIMWEVHKTGIGLCGVYAHEVAETKVSRVHEMAREHEFPLRCVMEKE